MVELHAKHRPFLCRPGYTLTSTPRHHLRIESVVFSCGYGQLDAHHGSSEYQLVGNAGKHVSGSGSCHGMRHVATALSLSRPSTASGSHDHTDFHTKMISGLSKREQDRAFTRHEGRRQEKDLRARNRHPTPNSNRDNHANFPGHSESRSGGLIVVSTLA